MNNKVIKHIDILLLYACSFPNTKCYNSCNSRAENTSNHLLGIVNTFPKTTRWDCIMRIILPGSISVADRGELFSLLGESFFWDLIRLCAPAAGGGGGDMKGGCAGDVCRVSAGDTFDESDE